MIKILKINSDNFKNIPLVSTYLPAKNISAFTD